MLVVTQSVSFATKQDTFFVSKFVEVSPSRLPLIECCYYEFFYLINHKDLINHIETIIKSDINDLTVV